MDVVNDPEGTSEAWEQLPPGDGGLFNAANRAVNAEFSAAAIHYLQAAGAEVVGRRRTVDHVDVAATVIGKNGDEYLVLAHGTFDDGPQAGLRRTDTLKKAGFDARLLKDRDPARRVIIVTSNLPTGPRSGPLLDYVRGFAEVISTSGDLRGLHRLHHHFGGPVPVELPAPCLSEPQLELFGEDFGA
jgi:hypothetical protein